MRYRAARNHRYVAARRCAAAAACALAVGCGGDPGPATPDAGDPDAAGDGAGGDGVGPEVQVVFPPPRSLTTAFSITVRGTASDPDGVAAVRVGGADATTADGFATWQAVVPLSSGDNALAITAEDALGNAAQVGELAVQVSPAPLHDLVGIAVDAAGDRAFTVGVLGEVTQVALATGERTRIAEALVVPGLPRARARAIAWDSVHQQVVVSDSNHDTIYAVDPATGARGVLSDNSMPGPALGTPRCLAHDAARDRLLVGEGELVLAVDPVTGARQVVSGGGVGSGPTGIPLAMVFHAAGDRLLVVALVAGERALVAVDPDTGDRTMLSGGGIGSGPFLGPEGLTVNAAGTTALTMSADAVIAVDLATGVRTIMSGLTVGTGPALHMARGLTTHPVTGEALVLEHVSRAVLRVDPATGDRAFFSAFQFGDAPLAFARPLGLAWDTGQDVFYVGDEGFGLGIALPHVAAVRPAPEGGAPTHEVLSGHADGPPVDGPLDAALLGDMVFLVDEEESTVLGVNTQTGERTLVSGGEVGTGPVIDEPIGIDVDAASGRLFVSHEGDEQLLVIDPATGAREVFASADVGSGPWERALDVAFEPSTGFALAMISDLDLMLGVEPVSRDRVVISAPDSALPLEEATRMVLDAPRGRLLAASCTHGLIAIDRETGARSVVASRDVGNGPVPGCDGLAIDEGRGLVAATGEGGVQVIDVVTGDRVMVAR